MFNKASYYLLRIAQKSWQVQMKRRQRKRRRLDYSQGEQGKVLYRESTQRFRAVSCLLLFPAIPQKGGLLNDEGQLAVFQGCGGMNKLGEAQGIESVST
jgi:hypothetical protein